MTRPGFPNDLPGDEHLDAPSALLSSPRSTKAASRDFDPRRFIASVEWRFAKTMAHYNPHWYVVERDHAGEEFTAFVGLIGTCKVRLYQGHPYRHVCVDGRDYWLTSGGDARNIINRKPSDKAGWDDQTGWVEPVAAH